MRMGTAALGLYRTLLRDARKFPVGPVSRKLEYNYREMFELYRDEKSTEKISELMQAGKAALRILHWLKCLPEVTLWNIAWANNHETSASDLTESALADLYICSMPK